MERKWARPPPTTPSPRLQTVAAGRTRRQALPGGPDLRPRGRPGAACRRGPCVRIPLPPQPPLRAGALLGTFRPADLAEGKPGEATHPGAATPLLRRPDGPPNQFPAGRAQGVGVGEEAQARGQRSHARNAHPFPLLDWPSGGSGAGACRLWTLGPAVPEVTLRRSYAGILRCVREVRDWLGGGGGLAAVAW